MTFTFAAHPPFHDGVVVLGRGADGKAGPSFAALDASGWLTRALDRARFKGGVGEAVVLAAPPAPLSLLVVLGMGEAAKRDRAALRRLGGGLAPHLARLPAEKATLALDLPGEEAAELAFGLRLAAQPLPRLRTRPDEDEPGPGPREVVVAALQPEAAQARWERLEPVAEGVLLARALAEEPPNRLGPQEFAEQALLLRDLGVEVEVLDEARLAKEGLNLLLGVGQGSARPPRLVCLRWTGGPAGEAPLVLVGKGITFDTGGISIKPADNMHEMKGDMAGAAAVLGAIRAAAGRKAPVNLCGVLAVAENMPGGGAMRPGDVVRSHAGLTVEVVDTDAEGRLVLADALSWACKTLKPRLLVDAATLTGAVVRTLGRHRAGLYTADDALAARLFALGEAEDEPLWRLPLTDRCDEDLKSPVADLRNCAWESPVAWRLADNDDAARFLQHFVAEGVPWAHLDIAGTADAAEPHALGPKGPTGFGVRLFDALAGDGEGG